MAHFNKIILLGNLTRDPQLTYLPSKTPVCEFGIATNRKWRGKDGNSRDEVMFVDCRVFGKLAETFNQYMAKGKPILIEGRLQLDRWEGEGGQKRQKYRVFVTSFTFIAQSGGGAGDPAGGAAQSDVPPGYTDVDSALPDDQFGNMDEIPF